MTAERLNVVVAILGLTVSLVVVSFYVVNAYRRATKVRLRRGGDQRRRDDADGPPPLVPEYHKARAEVVVSAGLLLLWRAGVAFEIQLPVMPIRASEKTPLPLFAAVLAYGVCRLVIEWFQSHPERRRRLVSKIDILLTLIIAAAGAWSFAESYGWRIGMPPLGPMIAGAGLAGFGIYLARRAALLVLGLFLIRSREEARRLALPRIPVASRAVLRMTPKVVPALLLLLILTPAFASPISYMWPYILSVPALIVFVADVVSLLAPKRDVEGKRISRAEFIRQLHRIHDRHDVRYQIGGWDRRIQANNAPLYVVAERGDTEQVRRILAEGADPNELNMHGWTALAIATAQRHRDVVSVLLASGANPNIANLLGRTPLMFAARYGDVELARELLRHGADVNLNESDDQSALSVAAAGGHLELVRLLLEVGADPARSDFSGRIPEQNAEEARQGACAAILRQARLKLGRSGRDAVAGDPA